MFKDFLIVVTLVISIAIGAVYFWSFVIRVEEGLYDADKAAHYCDLPRNNLDRFLPGYSLGCWLGARSENE